MTFKFVPKVQESAMQKALREATEQSTTLSNVTNVTKETNAIALTEVEDCTEKLIIIFDNSGSMSGSLLKMAKDGCIEFLRNCSPNNTAVEIKLINPQPISEELKLSSNLVALANSIADIRTEGNTPLFEAVQDTFKLLKTKAAPTRYIIFSDGAPDFTDMPKKESVIETLIENKIPADTIYITENTSNLEQSRAYRLMKEIAELTGGYFMVFNPSTTNFKTGFKYLTARFRQQLALPEVRKAVEAGTI